MKRSAPLILAALLTACTGGGAPAPNSPFQTIGSTRFVPGQGCPQDYALVGNRCVSVNNDFR